MKADKYIKAWHDWWTATDHRKIKRLERIMKLYAQDYRDMREQDKKL